MSEENLDVQDNNESDDSVDASNISINKDESKEPNIEDLVAKRVEEALRPLKGNLDKAYAARDEALEKLADIERKEKEAEMKRLQEEGKHKEAYELQLAEERARIKALEKQNVELTRDNHVRNALANLEFRSEKAVDMAFKEITDQMVRNDTGEWVHSSGDSLNAFVKAYAESQDNAFLFKSKLSSGSGVETKNTTTPSDSRKSLFDYSQEEVIKMAAEGKLPSQQ